jgi:hypothetical protein
MLKGMQYKQGESFPAPDGCNTWLVHNVITLFCVILWKSEPDCVCGCG